MLWRGSTAAGSRGAWPSSVVAGQFRSNDAGRMVQSVWSELTVLHPGMDTDGVVIMRNMFTALWSP